MSRIINIIFIMLFIPVAAWAADNEELWGQSLEYYDSGEYQKAVDNYITLLEKDIKSPELYFNLGNSYFKMGQLGMSVWAYRTSLKIDPGYDPSRQNLEYVKEFNIDKIEKDPGGFVHEIWRFISNLLSINGFLVLLMISWWAFLALFAFLTLKGRISPWPQYLLIVCSIIVIFSSGAAFSRIKSERLSTWGVIIAPAADIREGPGQDYDKIEVGHDGLEFKIISERDQSYLIELDNGLKGWIEKSKSQKI